MKEIGYPSLSHRIVSGWAETIPACHPVSTSPGPNGSNNAKALPSEESQRQFHAFLSQASADLSRHPEWLDLPPLPDDGYDHFELLNKRPELNAAMRKIKRKLNDFLFLLVQIGMKGDPAEDGHALRIPKTSLRLMEKTKARLAQIGLTVHSDKTDHFIGSQAYPQMAFAWHWLATDADRTAPQNGKKNEPPLRFVQACFDEAHPYGPSFFRQHCASEPGLPGFLDWLETQNYKRFSNRDNRTTADWVKCYSKKSEPLKDAWAERSHAGFSMEYEWVKKRPVLYALRIPEYKKLLGQFSAMPPQVRSLVVRHTKHCDNCGYCTQNRQDRHTPQGVCHSGTRRQNMRCVPCFPVLAILGGNWTNNAVSSIKDFLLFIDAVLAGGQRMKLDRMMAILTLLQEKEWLQAPDLAVRFEVSVRTIYRDVGRPQSGRHPH